MTGKEPPATGGPTRRQISARNNGSLGGFGRADRYESTILAEWGSWGGKKVLAKYGREYFVQLRKLRTHYPKYESESPLIRPNRRLLAAKENGRKGGKRRAWLYSAESLRDMARQGGIATHHRYGNEFFRQIRKKRTYYLKGYLTRKTKARLREQALRKAETEDNWAIAELWRGWATNWEP